jgi:hypothetical protein
VWRSKEFAQGLFRKVVRKNREEQTAARRLEIVKRPGLLDAIKAAEYILGKPWDDLLTAYGSWGRDGVMYVLVRHGGYRLPELLGQMPGVRYNAAAQAIKRFGKSAEQDLARTEFIQRYRQQLAQMSNDR